MAEIEIIDQTLRDGQQSLWGMRMKVGQLAAVADDIDRAGYRVVDLTGSSIFECMMRYNREDPWRGLDVWRDWLPNSRLRSGCRSNCIAKFGLTPDSSAADIRSVRPTGRRALMIGAERSGLSDAALAVTTPVRIPMADGVDSLNAASATAIGCYALG